MNHRVANFKNEDVSIQLCVYGDDGDYFCCLSRAEADASGINDAFVPPGEIGALWVRHCENRWLVSGLVAKEKFPRPQDVRELVDFLLEIMLDVQEMTHIRIDRVESAATETLCASMEEINF